MVADNLPRLSNTYFGVVILLSLVAAVLDGRLGAAIFICFAGIPAIYQMIALLLTPSRSAHDQLD